MSFLWASWNPRSKGILWSFLKIVPCCLPWFGRRYVHVLSAADRCAGDWQCDKCNTTNFARTLACAATVSGAVSTNLLSVRTGLERRRHCHKDLDFKRASDTSVGTCNYGASFVLTWPEAGLAIRT